MLGPDVRQQREIAPARPDQRAAHRTGQPGTAIAQRHHQVEVAARGPVSAWLCLAHTNSSAIENFFVRSTFTQRLGPVSDSDVPAASAAS